MVRLTFVLLIAGCAPRAAAPPAPPAAPRAPNFDHDASTPLDVQVVGTPDRWDDIEISQITYASPRGGRVPAFVVAAIGDGSERRPAVILQHGMGAVDKTNLLPDAVLLARAGAIALLPDAPDQRLPALQPHKYADHENDPGLWEHTAVDLRRAVSVLEARADVDPQRIGFVGHSFGATMGAILAAVEPRIRALVLIAPGAYTATLREGQTAGLVGMRASIPKPVLARYVAAMEPYDAPRWLARAPKTATVLVQVAAYDPGVPVSATEAIVNGSTATTEVKRYVTGHFITSPSATRDRVEFLGRVLALPRTAEAMARELAPAG